MLTDAGWDKLVATAPGHVETVRRLVFDGLDEQDVADLARVCDAILERLAVRPQGLDRALAAPGGAASE